MGLSAPLPSASERVAVAPPVVKRPLLPVVDAGIRGGVLAPLPAVKLVVDVPEMTVMVLPLRMVVIS